MTDIDDLTATQLNDALGGLNYRRSTAAFVPPTRQTAIWVGAAAVVAATAVGAVVLSPDGTHTAYGWAPMPRLATPAEQAAAQRACDLTTAVTHHPDGTTTFAFSANDSGTPSMTLDTLDIRGNTYLATMHNTQASTICRVADLSSDPHVINSMQLSQPDGATLTATADSTLGPDVTVIAGFAPASAVSIEIDVPDLPTLHADVNGSMFAAWVPAPSWHGTATIRAYDDGGSLIATTDQVHAD